MFVVSYKKNNNKQVFKKMKENYGFDKIQNYIPIYKRFFSVNDNTYNNINLNHKYSINDIKESKNENIFTLTLLDEKENKVTRPSFFKFSPLLDPIKYMVGKYENITKDMRIALPKLKFRGGVYIYEKCSTEFSTLKCEMSGNTAY